MNFSGGRDKNRMPEILAQLPGFAAAPESLQRASTAQIDSHQAWTSGPGAFRYCVVIALADQ
jgi:hypothetical protein